MRSLHVISSAGMYGAEAVVLTLLRELGGEAALAVFDNRNHPNLDLHHAALAAGVESYTLPCAGQADRTTLPALRALARQTGAQVVHAHGYKADVYTALAAGASPWTMCSTCHNWCDTDLATRLYGALDRRLLRRAAAVAAVSADVRRRLLRSGLRAEGVRVIRNGIDPAPFTPVAETRQPANPDAPVIGFAGRLSQEKGADLFVEAARLILAQLPGARFLLAGDGPERGRLEARIASAGLGEGIRLLGRQNDMASFYRRVDLLLSPSRTEGLPMGLMEAMASALPVVATRVGDVPELALDGETGTLVAPGDPAPMARAVLDLLRNPMHALALGRAGAHRVAEHFSAQAMAAQYRAMYAEAAP